MDSRFLLLYIFRSFFTLYIVLFLIYNSTPPWALSVEHCLTLLFGVSIFDKAFWFLLIWDSVIPVASKPILHSLKRGWSAEQWYGKDDMLRWSTLEKFSLSGGSFNSLGLKYLVILTFCSFSAPRLIFCRNWVFSRIYFWATFFLNWDSFHARLNSHYEAWRKEAQKRLQDT